MKRLAAIRLVNWYHFVDETFRFEGGLLLMGDSGSGKSTVLDAVQLVLVADLQEVRFNKAANENSRRSLYGYVRYKLGSEDERNPGQQRYGRGACTSYVLLEFRDDREPTAAFVSGVVLEATEADTSYVPRSHFVLPRARVEEVPTIDDRDIVRPAREFRALVRERFPDAKLPPDVGTYRDELRHRLGVLPPSFHRLIVKALDFKPIGQVRQFVFDYLLDERPVDTGSLQANLDHYKKLEAEAKSATERIVALDRISEHGERISGERRTIESHQYVTLRATLEQATTEEAEKSRAIAEAELELGTQQGEHKRLDDQLSFLNGERDRVIGMLQQTPGFQEMKRLEDDLTSLENQIRAAGEADQEARSILALQTSSLELLLGEGARDLRRRRSSLFGDDELIGAPSAPDVVERLRTTLVREGALAGRDLATWSRRLAQAFQALGLARFALTQERDQAKKEGEGLEQERLEIEREGRQRYPDGAAALLHLLRTKLKGTREPRPVCELIEVPNERWRDAVEGYLNTRRFDVIVAPTEFSRALSLYERHKRGYSLPGRGEVFISGVGLIDIERIQARASRREKRSLAEQVATDDPLARLYADYLLGDVICCDSEQELRQHSRAITDSVMVYQNHVARQTAREVYQRHYIGEAARLRRRDWIDGRLGELHELFVQLARDLSWIKDAIETCDRARAQVARLPDLVELAAQTPFLEKRAGTLRRQIDRIDKKEIAKLDQERKRIEDEQKRVHDELQALATKIGGSQKSLERDRAALGGLERAKVVAATALDDAFAKIAGDRREQLERHYCDLRKEEEPIGLARKYETQRKNIETRVNTLVNELINLKTRYADKYGFPGDVMGDTWQDFADEGELWRDSRLPDYQERIRQAKEQAIQQLAEDIIFRLRENLITVQKQIDDLNRALKDVPFGADRYSFTREVASDHKAFYDLIMDAGRYESDSLFGAAAMGGGDTRKTLEDLFDRLVSGEAQDVKSELEAKADYREYFNYDIRIHHADKTFSSFDRVAGDKSGGETQTPYYIAIFASMYRMYRQLARDGRPSCGMVLLDEAFAKMDEPRARATLQFARGLDLQLLIAAAQGKSELVAPHVETTLYIHKDPQSGAPTVLDFSKEFHADDDAAPERT